MQLVKLFPNHVTSVKPKRVHIRENKDMFPNLSATKVQEWFNRTFNWRKKKIEATNTTDTIPCRKGNTSLNKPHFSLT